MSQHPRLVGGYESAKTKRLFAEWAKSNGHDRSEGLTQAELTASFVKLRAAKASAEADLNRACREWLLERNAARASRAATN